MDITSQLYTVINTLKHEKMWNTLSENEVIKLSNFKEEVYCSFVGKNSPYFGIEIFLGQDGKNAMIERLNRIYYPEYIYRYRQNSIVIYIDDRFTGLTTPTIKMYEKGRIPRILENEKAFYLYEILISLYDAIKLMQSQNILGHFYEGKCINYFYCSDKYCFEIDWIELESEVQLPNPLEGCVMNYDNESIVELDVIYLENETEILDFGLVVASENQVLYQKRFSDLIQLNDYLQELFLIFGKFQKVVVRDIQMKTLLKNYNLNIEVSSQLDMIDSVIEEEMIE